MLPYQQNLYKKNNKKRYRIRLRYIALPLIALGLMSFLFLLFSDTDENISIEVAKLPPSVEQIEKNLLPEIEPKKLISLKKELLKPVIKTEEIVAQKTNIAKELNKIEPAAGNKKKYNGLLPMRKPLLSKKINLPNLSQNNSGQKRLKVGKGDTLMNMLTKECKANYREAYNAIDALGAVYDPRNLKPGHEVLVYFKDDNARHELMGLEIQQDLINTVLVQRLENGDFVSGKRERPVKRILKGAKGEINSSLYVSADKMDVPDSIILSLIRTFSWGVDFQRDIRAGDKFEVMYEQFITEDGKNTGKGDILYATLYYEESLSQFTAIKTKTVMLIILNLQGHLSVKL